MVISILSVCLLFGFAFLVLVAECDSSGLHIEAVAVAAGLRGNSDHSDPPGYISIHLGFGMRSVSFGPLSGREQENGLDALN
jgi:hypothetical protein